MNPAIAEAIRKSAAVPSMPRVVTRFLEVIQDPNFDYDDVVKVLSADAGTVSEVLRLANSALFGVSRKVTNLKQALTLLGPRRTRSLVLGRYLVEAIGDRGKGLIDRAYFWRRSLATAVLGARLAERGGSRQREEVFLCALLADVGVTILAQAVPAEYEPFARQYVPHGGPLTVDTEQAALGTSHAEVSAMVLAAWALPETMCAAVRDSHADAPSGDAESVTIARYTNAADRVAKLLCEVPDTTTCADVCLEATRIAGLQADALLDVLGDVENDIEELAAVLRVELVPSEVYGRIAEAVRDKLAVAAS